VRRHPDIRWLRRPGDIAALAQAQARLLDALWPLVKPGGRLLYATCSVFRAEGSERIDAFLQRWTGARMGPEPASPGHLLGLPDNDSDAPADPGDGFFYALIELPMSVAVTLNYASPLFLALLMPWQLGERPVAAQYGSVALGFVGVALLLRPWEAHSGELFAGLLGLFSGVMAAFAYIHVRQLGRLGEPEWRTVFWFAAVALLGAAAVATVTGWHAPGLGDALPLVTLGTLATLGQLAMTRAYRKGDTVVVASFAYSTVVFSGILDVVIWHEAMPVVAWSGMALTVAAGIWAVKLGAYLSRR